MLLANTAQMPSGPNQTTRLAGLDALRVVAVLLVMGHHMPPPPATLSEPALRVLGVWSQGGWMGVDLFFVLSGFLVAGLLFSELRVTGSVHLWKFYGRRALKIYPAFYSFLAATAILFFLFSANPPQEASRWISEVLFVQSYVPAVWSHTWSLAVEEHFYLLLPFLLTTLKLGADGSRRDMNRTVVLAAGVGILCLGARFAISSRHPAFDKYVHLFPSHLRIDGLLFGVLVSWFWHFRRDAVMRLQPWRTWLIIAGILLLLPSFILPLQHPWIHTAGFTTNYLGAGAIILGTVVSPSASNSAVIRAAGRFGPMTYSIYLWHAVVGSRVGRLEAVGLSYWPIFLVYVIGSFAMGVAAAKVVEFPALRLRDRLLPREGQRALGQ